MSGASELVHHKDSMIPSAASALVLCRSQWRATSVVFYCTDELSSRAPDAIVRHRWLGPDPRGTTLGRHRSLLFERLEGIQGISGAVSRFPPSPKHFNPLCPLHGKTSVH